MTESPFPQRDHHCFISYASEDRVRARQLADWLTTAGLRVWLDQTRLAAGMPVHEELTRQMGNSRACLLVVSSATLTKNYVKHEVDIACDQQITQPGFSIVAALLDEDLDPTHRFPSLRKGSWMYLPNGELDVDSARRLLLALTQPVAIASQTRHVFVSCGWGETEAPVTRRVIAPLVSRGVRLIGDSADHRRLGGFGEEGRSRVQRIMLGCTGHVMVLPDRRPAGKSPEDTYRYFIAEWEISRRSGLSRRAFCVSRDSLPIQFREEAIEVGTAEDGARFERALLSLHDETEPVAPYSFLATDYKHDQQRNEAARDVLEHVLGMECLLGKDYPGEQLREAIVDKVSGANLVFADIACTLDEHRGVLRPNLNTCIEAGIGIGARRPVFVTALDPTTFDTSVRDKTTQVPFMFRNHSIQWYTGAVDFLAGVHRLAMATRRRILNDELAGA